MSGFVLLNTKMHFQFPFQSITVSDAGSVTRPYWVFISAAGFLFEKLFEYWSLNWCISVSSEVLTGFESVSHSDWEKPISFSQEQQPRAA